MFTPKTEHRALWVTATCVFAIGCHDLEQPADLGWQTDDEPPVDIVATTQDSPGTPHAVVVGDWALEASSMSETWWVEPYFHAFVPNEGLFVSGGGLNNESVSLSLPDGATFRANNVVGLRSVDRDWTVGAFISYPEAQLRDLRTREVLATVEGSIITAAVSADGSQAAFVACDVDSTRLILFDVPDRTSREVVVNGAETCQFWSNALNRAAFTDDGARLAFTTTTGELYSVDATTLDFRVVVPHAGPEELLYETLVMDLAVRPGTHDVVTTGIDGMLRTWSLDDLKEIANPIPVGTFRINQQTYAPQYTVSPVAFSPDGETLAFLNTEGDIVLQNSAGSVVLPSPEVPDEFLDLGRTANVPVTIVFGPSGNRLGVGYYWGPAIWGAPGDDVVRDDSLEIEMPGVVQADAGGSVEIPISVRGAGPLAAVRVSTASFDVNWYALEEGTLRFWLDPTIGGDVVVEIDDGFSRGARTVQIERMQ